MAQWREVQCCTSEGERIRARCAVAVERSLSMWMSGTGVVVYDFILSMDEVGEFSCCWRWRWWKATTVEAPVMRAMRVSQSR